MENAIYIVGIGPGREEFLTGQARTALERCDVIVGDSGQGESYILPLVKGSSAGRHCAFSRGLSVQGIKAVYFLHFLPSSTLACFLCTHLCPFIRFIVSDY